MSKPNVLILMLLLVGGLFALWRSQTETLMSDSATVSAVTVDDAGELSVNGAFAQDCAGAPKADVKRFPANLEIRLYRERTSLAACGLQADTFNAQLNLEPDEVPLFVIINGEVWAATLDQPGGIYQRQSLFPVSIDAASIAEADSESGAYQLKIRGSQAVGCDSPEIFTMRQAEGRVQIGVYNALSADVACPDMLVDVNATVNLPATELPADTLFEVNNFLIEGLETQNVNDSDKVLANINSVDAIVTGAPSAKISLDVEGEHPDGCDLPVQISQSRAGSTVSVEVYRIVPADMICPMILRPYQGTVELDGNFEPGSYTIKVNAHSQTLDV